MNPLVSILIPAYNAAPWIGETLASALAQIYPHCEIIVVDDGSRDDTLAIARGIAARHPDHIRVETQPNAGAAAARNHALRLARGDFIQYLDADDLLSPRKIELQLALLATRPAHTLATCRWGRFETDPNSARFVDTAVFRNFAPLEWMRLHCGTGAMMHPAAWLVPRVVANTAGPWNESLSLNDDGEYFARVVLASVGISFCPESAAKSYYRSGIDSSLSRRRSTRALASLKRSVESISALVMSLAQPDTLTSEDDARSMRQTMADYWQRLAFDLYPDDPTGSKAALVQVRRFGGSHLPPPLGRKFRWLAQLFGWRVAFRLRRMLPF